MRVASPFASLKHCAFRVDLKFSMKRVCFDESGNTGDKLLDPEQPFFTLASVKFSPTQEVSALEHFRNVQASELKFTKLRKYPRTRKAVRAFLESDVVSTETVAAYVVNQPHMVITKYCDLVIEPSFRAAGVDFYEGGCNLAMSNLLSMTMPTMAGPSNWARFLEGFVTCVRSRSQSDFDDWLRFTELLHSEMDSRIPDFAVYVAPTLMLRSPTGFFATMSPGELDPALTAFLVLVEKWGCKLNERFEAAADASKAIAAERTVLEGLSEDSHAPVTIGYDRRKMQFPLKMASLAFVDSRTEKQVQLADVIAGAISSGLRAKSGTRESSFEDDLLQIIAEKNLVVGGIWPSADITPEALGTNQG